MVHDGDFTFSLVLPRGERLAAERPGESYRLIHAAKLSRAFGPVFAGILAASVRGWRPPTGLEEQIAALAREKYANPAFLRGGRGSKVFTRPVTS